MPTRLNSTVESRRHRRCVLGISLPCSEKIGGKGRTDGRTDRQTDRQTDET